MKIICSILFFLTATVCTAQLNDNFSDGEYTSNPTWGGDTAQWEVLNSVLHSNDTVASDIFYLSTLSATAMNAQWEFWDRLQFNPSGNNYVDVYLISDSANLEAASINGFFVRIGNTADEISLYRRTGATSTKIIDGADGILNTSNNVSRIKVIRDTSNQWTLERDLTGTGNNYVLEGTATDTNFQTSNYFGLVVRQSTASFFRKHFFDDFYAGGIIVDTTAPSLTQVILTGQNSLDIKYSEDVEQTSAETLTNYFVDNGIGNPSSASRDISDNSLVHLVFSTAFISPTTYSVTVDSVRDLSSNMMALDTANFLFFVPAAGDIVINEILYNPRTGGYDFVELYNRSERTIDLSTLHIASGNLTTSTLDDIEIISTQSIFILPGQYLVLTEEPAIVLQEYFCPNPANIIQVSNLPPYNIDFDMAGIVDTSAKEIDKLFYYDSWQFPLLNDTKGISLERISPDKPTQDSTNWHSAAESVGFATPGYRNSQFSESSNDGSEISVSPEIFSPDNDGYNDVVNFNYSFNQPGYVANVTIFDSRGRHVRNLVKNELLGTSGSFTWDGVNDNREKSTIGIYIVFVELFKLDGTVKSFKKTCVLASRL